MSDDTNLQQRLAWRDRLLGWRAVAATTLASVILGSAGGAALAAAADGAGTDRGGFPGRGQFPGNGQFPGQMGGQAPTGQAPTGQPGQPPQGQLPGAGTAIQPATPPRTNDEEA